MIFLPWKSKPDNYDVVLDDARGWSLGSLIPYRTAGEERVFYSFKGAEGVYLGEDELIQIYAKLRELNKADINVYYKPEDGG